MRCGLICEPYSVAGDLRAVWRFALGGSRLAVCGRIAGGFADGLRADCLRFFGRFKVGSLRAVCERQAGGCRAICGWQFAATIN